MDHALCPRIQPSQTSELFRSARRSIRRPPITSIIPSAPISASNASSPPPPRAPNPFSTCVLPQIVIGRAAATAGVNHRRSTQSFKDYSLAFPSRATYGRKNSASCGYNCSKAAFG